MFALFATSAVALCPFKASVTPGQNTRINTRVAPEGYYEAFDALDFDAVKADIRKLFTESQEFWPADYGNYAPFFIRLAWHNSGSYRSSDGRGGADGGRQRFDPERSWDDNTNLDKARKLLEPIKQKYGVGLSWGDLIILTGDTAIESMGGPVLGFCGGRIDDADGFWSERLGPNNDQETHSPCKVPGACDTPFGTNVVGLIYVNPEGFHGKPVPELSAPQVRNTFARMGMDDKETVALIGGGHAFGKVHGACPTGPGVYPYEDPLHPWAGTCGTGSGKGKGVNAFTSGFEGPWTRTPTFWNNEYFKNLVDYKWEKHVGPGGHYQWRVSGADSPYTTFANNTGKQDIMMLTSDVSLMFDPEGLYQPIVKNYAEDLKSLDEHFSHAWYKLTSRDMGPRARCLGKLTPPVQPFQNPLPAPPATLADFAAVRTALKGVLTTAQPAVLPMTGGTYGPEMVRLAWRCAATFRVTDYQGGCNGARIRMSPQKDWTVNAGLDKVLALLEPVKKQFGEGLTWADLIVLAGTVALEEAGAPEMTFCGGRSDADVTAKDPISDKLHYLNMEPMVTGHMNATIDDLEQYTLLLGLNTMEFTALMGARALGQLPPGYGMGQRTSKPTTLGTDYFNNLVTADWMPSGSTYKAAGKNGLTVLKDDILLISAAEYLTVAQQFAGDEALYLKTLASAWTKLMNADRFDGPTRNLCDKPESDDSSSDSSEGAGSSAGSAETGSVLVVESASRSLLIAVLLLAAALVLAVAVIAALAFKSKAPRTQGWAGASENLHEPFVAKRSTSNHV